MPPRFISLFFLMVFAVSCKNQLTKMETDPDSDIKTTYSIRKKDNALHGPYTKSDSAGVLIERGYYRDGKLHGLREILYPDGKVKIRERYFGGEIDDLYQYYFPNGTQELKGYYVGGAMYGPWKKYDDKGNLLEIVTIVNNEEKGPFTEYYPNGKIQAQGTYLNGPNEDGILNLFDESGELYKTMLCDSGLCTTTWEKK